MVVILVYSLSLHRVCAISQARGMWAPVAVGGGFWLFLPPSIISVLAGTCGGLHWATTAVVGRFLFVTFLHQHRCSYTVWVLLSLLWEGFLFSTVSADVLPHLHGLPSLLLFSLWTFVRTGVWMIWAKALSSIHRCQQWLCSMMYLTLLGVFLGHPIPSVASGENPVPFVDANIERWSSCSRTR